MAGPDMKPTPTNTSPMPYKTTDHVQAIHTNKKTNQQNDIHSFTYNAQKPVLVNLTYYDK